MASNDDILKIIAKYQDARTDWKNRKGTLSTADNAVIERLIANLTAPFDYVAMAEATIAIEDILDKKLIRQNSETLKPDVWSRYSKVHKTNEIQPHESEYARLRQNEVTVDGYRMCPGGCDTAVGGCIVHSDRC